jgi:exonuclease VII large subunit
MRSYKYVNYSREALVHPLNIGVLLFAFVMVFLLSESDLVAHVIFSFILGLELIYLGVAPHLPRFQEHARKRTGENYRSGTGQTTTLEKLGRESRDRCLSLKNQMDSIREEFKRLPNGAQSMLDSIRDNLDGLVKKYVQMLELSDRYNIHLQKTCVQALNEKIGKEDQNSLKARSERLVQRRKRTLQVLRKRVRMHGLTAVKNAGGETVFEAV